jgi:hypothetical protein
LCRRKEASTFHASTRGRVAMTDNKGGKPGDKGGKPMDKPVDKGGKK